jgi:hypothetical protein
MMECGDKVGAVLREVRMDNFGEGRADYTVEGARIEQRRPTSDCGEFVAMSAGDSLD